MLKNIAHRWLNNTKAFLSRDGNAALALILIAIIVYALCLPNEMFWDDEDFILKNVYIKDWQFWYKFFTDNVIAGTHLISNYWRPLLQTIFAVEWHLWADWAPGWHAVSILAHGAAGALLFLVLNILTKNRTLALLAALVWVVHPAHSEAVVYPNSLGDSLSTIFILGGIFSYALFRRSQTNAVKSRWWWLAFMAYPLALLSKETGILLVAFVALADFFFLVTPGTFLHKARRVLAALWPFIVVAIGYIILRATVLNFNNSFNFYNTENHFTSSVMTRIATFFRVIALDAGFIFTPYDLRVERLIATPTSFFEIDVMWGAALCGGLIALLVHNWNKRPAVAFGIMWFFTALLPTSNLFVIINAMVYEHFIYTALIGIILIVLTFGFEWARDERKRRILIATILAAALAFGIRSAWRCLDWRTAITFYEQLQPTAPTSYRVLNNMGMAYADKGIVDKAEVIYKKAIALDPTNAVSYHNLANIYRDAGKNEEARWNYEKAIQLQPSFIFSYKSLAQIYINLNDLKNARRILEAYCNITDEKIYTLSILTELAYRQKDLPGARRYLNIWLSMDPENAAAQDALRKLGQ